MKETGVCLKAQSMCPWERPLEAAVAQHLHVIGKERAVCWWFANLKHADLAAIADTVAKHAEDLSHMPPYARRNLV